MAYNVQRRTHEIGIRMSMGAGRSQVLWMVTREALGLLIAGVLLGLLAALAASRLVSSMLFGLTASDPATMLGATGLLTITGLLAAFIPAYRASRVDPMVALRYE
jgi:ABC-type antimicrobial peptide transport system permease subunit